MGSRCPGMGPLRRVAAVLEYVRTHPQTDVSVPVLAARAGFSPFHFQRIFRVAVGETVGDYVRNRRLAQAAIELREAETSITEIALKTGYETPSAFTRAFGARYGMSPTAFRANALDPIAPVTNMGITIQVLPTFHLLGARHVGPHSSVPDVWRKLFDHACKRGLLSETAQLIGLSYDDPAVHGVLSQRSGRRRPRGPHHRPRRSDRVSPLDTERKRHQGRRRGALVLSHLFSQSGPGRQAQTHPDTFHGSR